MSADISVQLRYTGCYRVARDIGVRVADILVIREGEIHPKIQKEGINSLTRREKEFLKKASQRSR